MNDYRAIMRRMLAVVFICLSLGLAPLQPLVHRPPAAQAAAGVQLVIDPSAITVTPGQVFTLQVLVQAGAQLVDGAEAHLDFNPAFIRVRALTPGATLATILENKFDNASGTIDYAAGTLVKPRPSGTFGLAQIEFEALAVTQGVTVGFHTPSVVPRKSDVAFEGASVLGGTINGTISVQTGGGSPPTPVPTPIGGQGVGSGGGRFACAQWTVAIPAGVAPNGGTLHCGAFDPNVAPPAPAGVQLLGHTMNVHLYNDWGSWITDIKSPLTLCLPYSDNDIATAGGDPNNLVIQTAPVGGAWSALATTINTTTRQACASVNHLTLFDLAMRAPMLPALPPATYYMVQWGDTLFRVALRFRTTVAVLRAANGLTSNTIYPGQALVIPNASASADLSPASATLRTDPITAGRYVVEPGDTLFRIALRAGTTVGTLMAINHLASIYISAGQELIIPGNPSVAPGISPSPGLLATPVAGRAGTYVVQPGDTLFRIALNHATTVAALQAANGLTGIDIYPGQLLIIPGS